MCGEGGDNDADLDSTGAIALLRYPTKGDSNVREIATRGA